MLPDQGQHPLQGLLLPGHGVQQRLALVGGKTGLQGLDDGGVDGKRHVRDGLHPPDGLRQNARLVRQGNAGVDVQHLGAGGHLGQGVRLHSGEVPGLHLLRQQLAAGGIDAFADDDEGSLKADGHFPAGGGKHGVCHEGCVLFWSWKAGKPGQQRETANFVNGLVTGCGMRRRGC